MERIEKFQIVKEGDEVKILVHLAKSNEEFAEEFLMQSQNKVADLETFIKQVISERLPFIKVATVNILASGLSINSFPFNS